MVLSDGEIFEAIAGGHLVIAPFDDNNVQPSSIGLTADMRICSLVVERLGRAAEGGYQGMFQGG